MSTPDDHIDAVLRALASAEPAAGFEQRVQHAMRQAAYTSSSRTLRVPFASAVAALLVCAISIGIRMHRQPGKGSVAHAMPLPHVAPVQATPKIVATVPRLRPGPGPRRIAVSYTRPADSDLPPHENMPAPPLPLTAEERLVIRMVHRDRSPQLAELTPDARAHALRDDAEAYRTFFAPRPPLDGQLLYDQDISGGPQ